MFKSDDPPFYIFIGCLYSANRIESRLPHRRGGQVHYHTDTVDKYTTTQTREETTEVFTNPEGEVKKKTSEKFSPTRELLWVSDSSRDHLLFPQKDVRVKKVKS